MGEDKLMDQSQLAEDVAKMIKIEFSDYYLIKPLDPIKVKKEFSKPVVTGTSKDEEGIEAQDFDKVETEVKEVDSDYRKGVVIKRPTMLDNTNSAEIKMPVGAQVGDVVIFRETSGLRFDLVKDSRLLRPYDIIGIERAA